MSASVLSAALSVCASTQCARWHTGRSLRLMADSVRNAGIPSRQGAGEVSCLPSRCSRYYHMAPAFLPLMVPPIYVSLEKLDKRLLEASADLGATPVRTFFQVTLPLALPGVATGSMLVFILLMGEYILPQFLGGGKVFFIGNALVDLVLQSRNWPFGAAVSTAMVAIMFVTIALYMRFVLSRGDVRRAALA